MEIKIHVLGRYGQKGYGSGFNDGVQFERERTKTRVHERLAKEQQALAAEREELRKEVEARVMAKTLKSFYNWSMDTEHQYNWPSEELVDIYLNERRKEGEVIA
jgi:hypothetical protein